MKKKMIAGVSAGAVLLLAILGLSVKGTKAPVYINEIMTSNGSVCQDEDGDYSDWIELYNAGEESVSLEGFGLSDRKDQPGLWKFPDISMEPHSYLVIFASGKDRAKEGRELHTNFKLSSRGEGIYLSDDNGRLLSEVQVEEGRFDRSYGRTGEQDAYAWLSASTPGEKNTDQKDIALRSSAGVEFSYPAGYYDDTVYLELWSDEAEGKIYYTTDGSVPDLESFVYSGEEIVITDRSGEPNRYTDVWCTPVDFWRGDGNSYDPEPQYKATVIKARIYFPKEDSWSKEIWTNTYLINADYSMPIASLSLEEGLLFDEENGIYVPGKTYDSFVSSGAELPSDLRLWQGNYSEDKKVAGHLEYFEDGCKVTDNDITLRICGAASRGNAQKSFALYAGNQTFSYPLFGEAYQNIYGNTLDEFSSLRLRGFGNDWRRSMFRDGLSQALVSDLNLGTQGYRPCILLVNGEYFGVYELRENRDESFFAEHFGIQKGNLSKAELFGLKEETADRAGKDFLELIEFVKQNDLSMEENYRWVEEQLDVQNFIDYVLTEQYLYNVDWPENNALAFRSVQKRTGSEFEDGRWRFVLYDLDYAINYPEENNFAVIGQGESYISTLLKGLLSNEVFFDMYQNRFEELLETHFEPSKALELLESFRQEFEPEIEETLKRWNVYREDGTVLKEIRPEYWYEKMEDLKRFFMERPEYAREYFYGF